MESDTVSDTAGDTQSDAVSDTQSGQASEQVGEQVSEQVLELYNKVLDFCREPKSAKEIKEYLNIKSRSYISRKIVNPLILKGKLEYENKKHIKASNQRYVTVRDNKK